jgi:transcription elongation factor GreA
MSEKAIYLTIDGKRKLEDELEVLRVQRRQELAERIQQAKQFGDITESGEYEDAKNEQAFVEGRIRELESTLSHAHTLENGHDKNVVGLGATVTIMDDIDKEKETWMLVSSAEADTNSRKVSDESPFGTAMLGKHVGDKFSVKAPSGELSFTIVEID